MGIAFLEFTGFILVVLVLLFIATQIVLPLLRGTPFFPQFRKSTPLKEEVVAAQHELEETTELVQLKSELKEIKRRKAKLEKE